MRGTIVGFAPLSRSKNNLNPAKELTRTFCFFLLLAALHDDSLPGVGGGPAAPSMGRITGSASIETLVRVGIEKENGLVSAWGQSWN